MTLLRTAASALALGGIIHAASCVACNDLGCNGGLEWRARPEMGGAVAPGAYRFTIELDEGVYHFDCTVTELARESECVGPTADDDDEFEVDISLVSYQATEQWDRDAPLGSFSVRAWSFEDEDERSTRGPRDVRIVLERDGVQLVEGAYAIAYERDEDFYGDERCGFCDLQETRAEVWSEE